MSWQLKQATEECRCGAKIKVQSLYDDNLRKALAEWRAGHRCSEVPPVAEEERGKT